MKDIKEYIVESYDPAVAQSFKLVNFVSNNSNTCKSFARDVRDFYLDKDLNSSGEISKWVQSNTKEMLNQLNALSKKYFKCTFNGLDKKCKGLSDELLKMGFLLASRNIVDDNDNDWSPMYNK